MVIKSSHPRKACLNNAGDSNDKICSSKKSSALLRRLVFLNSSKGYPLMIKEDNVSDFCTILRRFFVTEVNFFLLVRGRGHYKLMNTHGFIYLFIS